jgi:hypothetical protein
MIQLHPDCLIFQTSDGQNIPCSAEVVTIELVGDSTLDPDMVREAAAAVVFYFKNELKRDHVSVEEFSRALQRVLTKFGYEVTGTDAEALADGPGSPATLNLPELASASGKGFELIFFPRLRAELRTQLKDAPNRVRLLGLRTCVKQLAGRRRWCPTCERLSDQIVDYLRECFVAEQPSDCQMVVC